VCRNDVIVSQVTRSAIVVAESSRRAMLTVNSRRDGRHSTADAAVCSFPVAATRRRRRRQRRIQMLIADSVDLNALLMINRLSAARLPAELISERTNERRDTPHVHGLWIFRLCTSTSSDTEVRFFHSKLISHYLIRHYLLDLMPD